MMAARRGCSTCNAPSSGGCTFKRRSHLGITGCGWADAPLLHSAIDVAPHDAAPHVVQEQPTAKGDMGTELRQALADLERLETMFMV